MIKRNVSLAKYTTFNIGGPVKYFVEALTSRDLLKAIAFSQSKNLPFFILGKGSNVLVSDKGFDGLVIKNACQGISQKNHIFTLKSGVLTAKAVSQISQQGYTGLEWAAGLPGTIGGAVQTQASCFNGSMEQILKKVEKKQGIILSVDIELKPDNANNIKKRIRAINRQRADCQPIDSLSAGCFFKNPDNMFAGQLIDRAGLKGKKVGQAMVSKKHANYIINLGKATSKDVCQLAKEIKETILEKYGIILKEEIHYLGI